MAFRTSRPLEARALLERAQAAFEAGGQPRLAARVSAQLADIDFMEGRPQEAIARMEPALAALSMGDADADVASVAERLGRFFVLSGEIDRAAPHLEHALELAALLDLPETLAHALSSRAVYLMIRDRLYEARALLEAAVALALEHDRHSAALRAYLNLAEAVQCSDHLGEAYGLRERALEFARLVGDRLFEAILLAESVIELDLLGRWDEALARAGEAEQVTSTSFTEIGLLDVISIHCARGEVERARTQLTRLAAVGASEDPQAIAAYAALEARLLRAEGRPVEALASAERALALRRELALSSWGMKAAVVEAVEAAFALGDQGTIREQLAILDMLQPGALTPLLKAHRARFRARLAEASDPQAETEFGVAEAIFRTHETPFYLAVTLLEHAESLVEQGRSDEAEPLLAEAHETFERLEARPWLERTALAMGAERHAEIVS